MPESPVGKLRHRRATILRRIAPLERKLMLHRARLALVEAAILALRPTLDMPLPQRKFPKVFDKGELTRLGLDMLRRAGRPMAMGEMVRGCLSAKGLRFPDRQRRSITERHLQNAFARFEQGNRVTLSGAPAILRIPSAKEPSPWIWHPSNTPCA